MMKHTYCDGRYKYGLCLRQLITTKHSRKGFWCNVFALKKEICCLG